MSTVIVTLPNSTAGLTYFPASAFTGLKLDVKRTVSFESTISRAASGRETGVSWRELPIITFEITWEFLDDNDAMIVPSQTGAPTYTEMATLLGFFEQQHGDLLPFFLRLSDLTMKPADSLVTGQQIAVGDGVSTNFQLCRTVGAYLEPIQMPDPAGALAVYKNGILQSSGWALLPAGIVQFAVAPTAGVVISADIPWLYLCRFDAAEMEIDQWALFMHECQSLKLRTVIQ